MCLTDTKSHNLRITVKSSDKNRRDKINKDSDALCHDKAAPNAKAGSFFCPVVFSGSQVLADKGGQSHGEAGDRKKAEAFYLGVCAASGYRQVSKTVDIGLDDYIGQRDDRILKTGRKSVADDLAEHKRIQMDFADMYPVFFRAFSGKPVKAEKCADKLGDNGCRCSSAHTHMEASDKKKIQTDIDQRGKNQIVQRMFAVSDRLHDSYKIIVKDKGHRSQKIDPEVADGVWKYIGRGLHQNQDFGNQKKSKDGQKYSGYQTESNGGMYGFLKIFCLSCAVIAGDHHAGADSNSIKKAHQKKNDTSGGADGSQCITSQKIPDDQGVGSVIKLLKKIAEKNRKSKRHHFFPDRAFGQKGF